MDRKLVFIDSNRELFITPTAQLPGVQKVRVWNRAEFARSKLVSNTFVKHSFARCRNLPSRSC